MSDLVEPAVRKAVIRTSDRSAFRRCRRKWAWSSGLRQNLTQRQTPSYYWIGTGGHFALEDWHGYNHYGHPVTAFRAYVDACRQAARHGYQLPDDYEEQATLGEGLLEYYLLWHSQGRDPLKTVWIDDEPQCELKIELELPIKPPEGYDVVVYQLTIDRLVEIDGEYWIQDYKFHKNFEQGGLEFNSQFSSYIWGASLAFDVPIAGGIMTEIRKELPKPPRILGSGKLSTAQDQLTTHFMYREALEEIYGTVSKAPAGNIRCLNDLAAQETEERDRFIKRGRTRRTEQQQHAEGQKILMEAEDMLNPNLPLYPNATRDCSWDCSDFRDVCLMMDRDDNWHPTLQETTVSRSEEDLSWRNHLQ